MELRGNYARLRKPNSDRELEDKRRLRLIRASFEVSQGVYGAPRVFLDLREAGETCSKHRVARLMRENNIRTQPGYRTRRYVAGKPAELIPDLVKRNFEVSKPNRVWVSDITNIRTWEGWLYLAIVMDLFSRKIVGWVTRSTIHIATGYVPWIQSETDVFRIFVKILRHIHNERLRLNYSIFQE